MFEHWKDHFHPHEGNDHHPHAYRAGGAIALALVIMAIVAFSGLQTAFITQSERFLAAVLPSVLVDLTNEDRADEGLASLEANETLRQAAQMKADHMAEHSYFAHDAPDGTTPWEWFARAGYEYELAGENLAINFSDSADVEKAWMNSPTHRENILEQGFTEIGIATAKGEYEGDETVFVVQMFGRPSAAELAEREGEQLAVADNTAVEQEAEPADNQQELAETASEPEPQPEPAVEASANEPAPTQEPEPEPEPVELNQEPESTPEPDESAEEDDSVSPSEEQGDEESTTTEPTPVSESFATPTPTAQVEGEAGIALLPFGGSVSRQASRLAHLMSQPKFIFKTLIFTLFALIALILLVSVGVEAKRHHVNHALKSLGALAVLMLVFYFGTTYLFPDPEVANYSDSRLSATISLEGSDPSR